MNTYIITGIHATGMEFSSEIEDLSLLNAMRNMDKHLLSVLWFTHGIVSIDVRVK